MYKYRRTKIKQLHREIHAWLDLWHLDYIYSFQYIYIYIYIYIYHADDVNLPTENKTKINLLLNKKIITGKENLKVIQTQD